jgi:hypothetical protein
VHSLTGGRKPEEAEESVNDDRHRRLTDPAEGERRDCYSELRPSDVAIEMSQRTLNFSSGVIARFDHLVDSASSYGNKGELGGDEKRVKRHQKQNDTQPGTDFTRAKVFGRTLKKGQEIHIL